MSTSDIIKASVFDPRIVQTRPKYAVEKGALSITNVSVSAQTTSNSSVQWNIQVPSENVFVDRAVDLVAQQYGYLTATVVAPPLNTASLPAGTSLSGLIAPAAFPIQQSVTQASATINDATVTVNTQDVLPQILRLSDMATARMQRTCPTMLDRYAIYPDTNNVASSPLSLYNDGFSPDEIPNGAFNGFQFTTAAGAIPASGTAVSATTGSYTIVNGQPTLTSALTGYSSVSAASIASGTATLTITASTLVTGQYVFLSGLTPASGTLNGFQGPVTVSGTSLTFTTAATGAVTLSSATAAAAVQLPIYFTYTSTEKLLLPPFIFTGQEELSTGLFGVQNFQVQLNIAPSSQARSIRASAGLSLPSSSSIAFGSASCSGSSFTWGYTSGTGSGLVFGSVVPRLLVQFLTPSLDIPLPPKNIVPYMEFPRYISASVGPTPLPSAQISYGVTPVGVTNLASVTTTLPNIPDLMMIYVKPTAYTDATNGDWSLPITRVSLNFDNFSGLLANHTPFQLYKMSVDNGLDMDWNLWSGQLNVNQSGGATSVNQFGGVVGSAGGVLVLRPGRDFALQAGQAPGLVGNFTVQFTLDVQNNTGYTGAVNIYLVPISSGFFETIKGSSRIIKGVLTEQDILSAPLSAPSPALERVVGGKMMSQPTHSMPDGSQMAGIAHQLKPRKGRAMHNYM